MSENRRTPASAWFAVGVALVWPTLITWAYFVALANAPPVWQQAAYLGGKFLQFAFPVGWFFGWQRERLRGDELSRKGSGLGFAFGALVALAMALLYDAWLAASPWFLEAQPRIIDKITRLQIDSPLKYAALGVFYSLAHSGLEEYYWRWFVFGQLQTLTSRPVAIAVSALGFMAHHVLVLGQFFGATSSTTWLLSAGVAIGGAVWAWQYDRSRSLLGPWLGHFAIDAAIFAIGYDVVRSQW